MTAPVAPAFHEHNHQVACVDAVGRDRFIAMRRINNRIALSCPPAESALLDARQARQLAQQLTDFANHLDGASLR